MKKRKVTFSAKPFKDFFISLLAVLSLLTLISSCSTNTVLKEMMSQGDNDVFDNLYHMKSIHDDGSFEYDSVIRYRTEKALIYYASYHGVSIYPVANSSGIEEHPFATHVIYYISIEDNIYDFVGRVGYSTKNEKYSPEELSYIADEYKAALNSRLETKVYTEDEITAALAEAKARAKAENSSAVASSAQ